MIYKKSELLTENRESFIHWLFIALISQKGGFTETPEWKDFADREEFDIKLTVQGVEVDFLKSMSRVEQHIHRMDNEFDKKVHNEAIELLKEKFGKIIYATQEVLQTTTIEQLKFLSSENDEMGLTQNKSRLTTDVPDTTRV